MQQKTPFSFGGACPLILGGDKKIRAHFKWGDYSGFSRKFEPPVSETS
jgi:hypothetical protein